MEQFSKEFKALLNEAHFTKELLGIGVTQLYKANYTTKGIYYLAFTSLTTGLERMTKLCFILDYYIEHNGVFPEESYIRPFGHKINLLFQKCREIAKTRKLSFDFTYQLDDIIYQNILDILNDFAQSSGRYYNLNTLFQSNLNKVDCLKRWHEEVDDLIYRDCVTSRKKQKINNNATMIHELFGSFMMVSHLDETGDRLDNVMSASSKTGIWEAVAPYRQLYVLRIIRYLTEILGELGFRAQQISITDSIDIPDFLEIFALFYNSDSYLRSRKTWEK